MATVTEQGREGSIAIVDSLEGKGRPDQSSLERYRNLVHGLVHPALFIVVVMTKRSIDQAGLHAAVVSVGRSNDPTFTCFASRTPT